MSLILDWKWIICQDLKAEIYTRKEFISLTSCYEFAMHTLWYILSHMEIDRNCILKSFNIRSVSYTFFSYQFGQFFLLTISNSRVLFPFLLKSTAANTPFGQKTENIFVHLVSYIIVIHRITWVRYISESGCQLHLWCLYTTF